MTVDSRSRIGHCGDPPWLDRERYPFDSRFIELELGRLHYIDEGPRRSDRTLVLVHGAPTWSFMYRHVIEALRSRVRCVAMDHLGFGLSDKPDPPCTGPEHTANLSSLLTGLEIDNATLVVHDFGGPIGLSWAIRNPTRLASVVILNSWMWPFELGGVKNRLWQAMLASRAVQALERTHGVMARYAVEHEIARYVNAVDKEHYLGPLRQPGSCAANARLVAGGAQQRAWFSHLWQHRNSIAGVPMTVVWGGRDSILTVSDFCRLLTISSHAPTARFLPSVGHFVAEEAPQALIAELETAVGLA